MKSSIIVGRFQCPYLHEGHKHLIDTAIKETDLTMIIIGCTKNLVIDERNPYTFDQRAEMIKKEYPKVLLGYIIDEPDDDLKWSQKLDETVSQLIDPVLYGSRDSFYKYYKGHFPYREVQEIPDVSATKIRQQLNDKIREQKCTA